MAFLQWLHSIFLSLIDCAPLALQEIFESRSLLRNCIAIDLFCNLTGSLLECREISWKLWLRSHIGTHLCFVFPIELSWWLIIAFKHLLLCICVPESVFPYWQQVPLFPLHAPHPNGVLLHLLDSKSVSLDLERNFQKDTLVEVARLNLLKINKGQPWRHRDY